jgi:hypothetical protein
VKTIPIDYFKFHTPSAPSVLKAVSPIDHNEMTITNVYAVFAVLLAELVFEVALAATT